MAEWFRSIPEVMAKRQGEDWTAEESVLLQRMKIEQSNWENIADALGRSPLEFAQY